MLGKIDPRKLQGMMSKLGIKQEEIEAERVIIEQKDKDIVVDNPSVIKVSMSGNESFQISGIVKEREKGGGGVAEEDIKTVMEKTSCSREEAEKALEQAGGDLAEAILSLS